MSDKIALSVNANVTPELVASLFWGLNSVEQADFFAELERMAGVDLCFQMANVVYEIVDRSNSGERDALNGFQTMLSHANGYAESAIDFRVARAKADIFLMGKSNEN